jgi:hypothetical protein
MSLQSQLQEVRLAQRSKFLDKWREEKPASDQVQETWGLNEKESPLMSDEERIISIGDMPSIISTSNDPQHPPMNVLIDGPAAWITTGLFPQGLSIRLAAPIEIASVALTCLGIRTIRLHSAAATVSLGRDAYDLVSEHTFPAESEFAALPASTESQQKQQNEKRRTRAQAHTFTLPGLLRTRELKLTISSGHNDFAAISRLRIHLSKKPAVSDNRFLPRDSVKSISTVSGLSRLAPD